MKSLKKNLLSFLLLAVLLAIFGGLWNALDGAAFSVKAGNVITFIVLVFIVMVFIGIYRWLLKTVGNWLNM